MSSLPTPDSVFLSFQLAVAGRYSIDRELGRGGMGIVYLAREVHLDRLVAIKLLPPEKATEPPLRERFLREARMAAKLSHPNIIPIHSVEETGEFVYYVMAFVDGETLAHRVRTRGPTPSAEGARVIREVAWALAYAHGQGIVHRDVKPENILLETSTGRVLVADFGIAAARNERNADGIAGTPEFMSPEQALGKEIDARSDLYALGATAFYAFSGRFPFEGNSVTEVLAKQVTEAAPPLASLGLTVPRKIAAIVDRCLAKDAEHRPPNAEALAEQLSVAIERRRELPAALRAFVKRQGRLNGGGTLIVAASLLPVSMAIAATLGGVAGFLTFGLGLTAAPLAHLVVAARRLTLLGFAHGDVGPAFASELEQAQEELTLGKLAKRSRLERLLGGAARVFGLLAAVSGLTAVATDGMPQVFAVSVLIPAWSATIFSSIGVLALRQRHRDVDTEFWSKVWLGRIGKLAFSIARKLTSGRATTSAVTHRATELSLGMAAEQLFESLPKDTKRALGDLPGVMRRLQDDAQLLRKRLEATQEALADVRDAASAESYAEVRESRDSIQSKLAEAVGALETIRLNLLRLHAGSATVEGLTTHLGVAAEVAEQVERLVAAHEEIERSLKFPREGAATPA
jgi:eukaryotic-like serine/threonine-protein kinase